MDPSTTERTLHDLVERMATLEQENQNLRVEMGMLRTSMLRSSTPKESSQTSSSQATTIERVSRRWMLRRAAQATAATVAASVLIRNDTHEAEANHSTQAIDVAAVYAHFVVADTAGEYPALRGSTTTDNYAAVAGTNHAGGTGVDGNSTSGIGVHGTSGAAWRGAVYGENTAMEGYGVVADASGTQSAAVLGRNGYGDAVRGEGMYGVHGVSTALNQIGVYGENSQGYGVVGNGGGATNAGVLGSNSIGDGMRGEGKNGIYAKSSHANGYGAVCEGGKAQLRLIPKSTQGKPTGAHAKGEIYLDNTGTIFICTAPGTPGTWRKVSTTLA